MKIDVKTELIPQTLFEGLFLSNEEKNNMFLKIMDLLPSSDQKKWLLAIIKHISTNSLTSIDDSDTTADYPVIWAAIGAIRTIMGTNQARKALLADWLTSAGGAGIGDGCGVRRAVVGALAEDKDMLATVLEKCTNQFGDQLFIKHAPILQQEGKPSSRLCSIKFADADRTSSMRTSSSSGCRVCTQLGTH